METVKMLKQLIDVSDVTIEFFTLFVLFVFKHVKNYRNKHKYNQGWPHRLNVCDFEEQNHPLCMNTKIYKVRET